MAGFINRFISGVMNKQINNTVKMATNRFSGNSSTTGVLSELQAIKRADLDVGPAANQMYQGSISERKSPKHYRANIGNDPADIQTIKER